ncbi:MAG TPA: PIG-L family deacetylase [Trebonia sp.]|nr:PIG-L family deacetylase [Trebonia sp.]
MSRPDARTTATRKTATRKTTARTTAARPHPIDAAGTDERTWAAWPWLNTLPGAGLALVSGARSAVIVAAHPDDEVLGAGGVIAMLAAARTQVRLVAVTDGERSHRGHASPASLARRRTGETASALRALGARTAEVIRLQVPDTGVAACEDELTAALAPLVSGFDLCLAPWDHDLHPDHEAAGRAARRARRGNLYHYPVWMWHWASPGDPRVPWDRAVRVPLPPRAASRKRAAITCFGSQTEDRGHGLGPVLSQGMIAHFTRAMEVLLP